VALGFSFGEVESVLLELHRIAENKRGAFRARLKHLQRLGFPAGANTGTGRPAEYTLPMLLQLCLATELAQAGLSPKRVVQIVEGNWETTAGSLFYALLPDELLSEFGKSPGDNRLVWLVSPEALRDLTEKGECRYDYVASATVHRLDELPSAFTEPDAFFNLGRPPAPPVGEFYRLIAIQLRPFVNLVMRYTLMGKSGATAQEFVEDLRAHVFDLPGSCAGTEQPA
jgi:hypothetical protein